MKYDALYMYIKYFTINIMIKFKLLFYTINIAGSRVLHLSVSRIFL